MARSSITEAYGRPRTYRRTSTQSKIQVDQALRSESQDYEPRLRTWKSCFSTKFSNRSRTESENEASIPRTDGSLAKDYRRIVQVGRVGRSSVDLTLCSISTRSISPARQDARSRHYYHRTRRRRARSFNPRQSRRSARRRPRPTHSLISSNSHFTNIPLFHPGFRPEISVSLYLEYSLIPFLSLSFEYYSLAHALVHTFYFERDRAISPLFRTSSHQSASIDEGSRMKKTSRARNPH